MKITCTFIFIRGKSAVLRLLYTILADTAHNYLNRFCGISIRQIEGRGCYLVEAFCFATYFADEMNMIVVMMPFGTIVFTQCIPYHVIRRGDGMNDSFFN